MFMHLLVLHLVSFYNQDDNVLNMCLGFFKTTFFFFTYFLDYLTNVKIHTFYLQHQSTQNAKISLMHITNVLNIQ